MTEKELREIKRRFRPERSNIPNIVGAFVNENGEISLQWANHSNQNERGFQSENMATTICYWEREEDEMEELDADGEHTNGVNLGWVALKQQYFSSAFIGGERFNSGMSFATSQNGGADFVKAFNANIYIPFNAEQDTYNFAFYYGPNDFKVLKDVTFEGQETHLEDLIPMGGWLVGWINRFLTIPVFNWLSNHGLNFGLIILILTLLVKIIILPLTYKSYMSTAKMRAVRPELEALNAKYPKQEDAMKKQQAMMDLYQKAGISPMGGCLPMLLQMPILFAMFRFFPASIELRQQKFLWADDLSAYDSIWDFGVNIPLLGDHLSLFALLMAVTMFIYSKMTSAQMSDDPNMAGMKFMSVWLMPIMMFFICNNLSSALSYYYLLSNIITMAMTWYIRKFVVTEEKVRADMMLRANQPKKKSKWQQKLEEAQKMQEQMQKQQGRR